MNSNTVGGIIGLGIQGLIWLGTVVIAFAFNIWFGFFYLACWIVPLLIKQHNFAKSENERIAQVRHRNK